MKDLTLIDISNFYFANASVGIFVAISCFLSVFKYFRREPLPLPPSPKPYPIIGNLLIFLLLIPMLRNGGLGTSHFTVCNLSVAVFSKFIVSFPRTNQLAFGLRFDINYCQR